MLTLMFLPPSITEFICSKASCAASGTSYSTNAKPCRKSSVSSVKIQQKHKMVIHKTFHNYEKDILTLCFNVTESQDMSMLLMGPKGAKACLMVSSPSS